MLLLPAPIGCLPSYPMSTNANPDSWIRDDLPPKASSREAILRALAEERWAARLHGSQFEESHHAQRPESRLRTLPPAEHRHGSSLLQGANSI